MPCYGGRRDAALNASSAKSTLHDDVARCRRSFRIGNGSCRIEEFDGPCALYTTTGLRCTRASPVATVERRIERRCALLVNALRQDCFKRSQHLTARPPPLSAHETSKWSQFRQIGCFQVKRPTSAHLLRRCLHRIQES